MQTAGTSEVPSRADILDAFDSISTAWDQAPNSRRVRNPETLFAIVSHCATLARAIRLLFLDGQELAAMPLIRQLVEFGVRAAWLETFHESGPTLTHAEHEARRRVYAAGLEQGMLRWRQAS